MKPNISVIVPIYNTEKYLQTAIDSLLKQRDFLSEIILINDGSTDGSGELIEELYGKNKFVKIFHTENQGQGLARNLGTKKSTGNFIYYFDSDDISKPDLFRKFNDVIVENPTLELFCFSGESFLDKETNIEQIIKKSLLSKEAYKRKLNKIFSTGEETFRELVKHKAFFPGPPFYIVKKSLLLDNNILFRSIRYEDEEFTHKLFLFAGKTVVTNDVLFERRVRIGSTMQSTSNFSDISGYFKIVESLSELKKLDFISNETQKMLDQRILNFIRLIVELKTIKQIKLTKQEQSVYKNFLKPYFKNNLNLAFYSFQFPLKYKLKKIKKALLK